ncbi:MAG TPA: CsbD family protein [Ramlibacter sp.]|uniref:CsbD family protein n=1 Tax=Ramlibacter sp. TaxID=1917967 RepID=UPI002D80484F|nr:CsbD family protein [Ramlibacter sp.]HET8748563.1 CsbD family protein [Ramlibacter sp.]
MNKQQIKGTTNRVTGEIKQQVGRMTGDSSTTARGQAREIKGRVQQGIGNARDDARKDRELERDIERDRMNRR